MMPRDVRRETDLVVYEIVCTLGEGCRLYDPETDTAWWDHVGGRMDQYESEIKKDMWDRITGHLDTCKGPMSVTRLES